MRWTKAWSTVIYKLTFEELHAFLYSSLFSGAMTQKLFYSNVCVCYSIIVFHCCRQVKALDLAMVDTANRTTPRGANHSLSAIIKRETAPCCTITPACEFFLAITLIRFKHGGGSVVGLCIYSEDLDWPVRAGESCISENLSALLQWSW